jgi:hypothetical protein
MAPNTLPDSADLYGDASKRLTVYRSIVGSLLSTRQGGGFDATWQDLRDFMAPRRTRFWTGDRNRGDRRDQWILNNTARFSARTLASGLHSGLTSPARPWMKLTTPDASLMKLRNVRIWLEEVTGRMLTLFGTSNVYNVLPTVYGDFGVFGTAAMALVEDSKDLVRAYSYPLGSFVLGQDERGLTTTFAREYEISVRQVVETFAVIRGTRQIDWTRVSGSVKSAWDNSNYETAVPIMWLVKPNDQRTAGRLEARYAMPWTSCYWESQAPDDSARTFLRESGFNTFPIMAPRWEVTGEDAYGTDCPGMMALGDVKQLQTQERKKGQAIAKQVDPPLVGPTSLKTQKTSLLPGDITYVDVREGMQGLRPVHDTGLNLRDMTFDISKVEYRIQRAFYEDLFLMLARSDDQRGAQPPTAREVDERHEEKLLALGPTLERTNDELLDPIVDRMFDVMGRAGLLPPPPEELRGVNLKVEYTSILAQAQKLVGVVGQDRFLQSIGVLAQAYPEVRHKVDAFRAVDNYADMLGVDSNLVRSNEDATADLNAERQAAAQQQQAGTAVDVAKAAKLASDTNVSGDNLLNRIAQGASSAQSASALPSPASPNPAALPAPAGR